MSYQAGIQVTQQVINEENNTSRIIVQLGFCRTDAAYVGWNLEGSATWSMIVDGKSASGTWTFNYPAGSPLPMNTWREVASRIFQVPHNTDGTKTVSMTGQIYFGAGVSPGTLNCTNSQRLNSIPVSGGTPSPTPGGGGGGAVTPIAPDPPVINSGDVVITEGSDESALNAFNCYVQNHSKLHITSNIYDGRDNYIYNIKVDVGGRVYYGDDIVTDVITESGTVYITVTAEDDFDQTAIGQYTVNICPYHAIDISEFAVSRCDSAGVLTPDGTALSIKTKFDIAPVNNKNVKSYTIDMQEKGAASWTALKSGAVYSYDTTGAPDITPAGVVTIGHTYTVRLTVTDSFGSAVASSDKSVSTFRIFNVNTSKRGIAFGKISDANNFEVAMPAKFDETVEALDEISGTKLTMTGKITGNIVEAAGNVSGGQLQSRSTPAGSSSDSVATVGGDGTIRKMALASFASAMAPSLVEPLKSPLKEYFDNFYYPEIKQGAGYVTLKFANGWMLEISTSVITIETTMTTPSGSYYGTAFLGYWHVSFSSAVHIIAVTCTDINGAVFGTFTELPTEEHKGTANFERPLSTTATTEITVTAFGKY